jgi:MFS family permease
MIWRIVSKIVNSNIVTGDPSKDLFQNFNSNLHMEGDSMVSLNLTLSLILVFLFSSNYYMLSVTASEYLELIKFPHDYAGLLNGATPLASVISGAFTAYWTSHNYKLPMATTCFSILLANGAYLLALYNTKYYYCLLLGRVLLGIGGTGLISRRYMSEHVSWMNRAKWSAALIIGSGLGMASGPFIAVFTRKMTFTVYGVVFADMMLPAAIYLAVWVIYTLLVIILFREIPDASPDNEIQYVPYNPHSSWLGVLLGAFILLLSNALLEGFLTGAPIMFDSLTQKNNIYYALSALNLLVLPTQLISGCLGSISNRFTIIFGVLLSCVGCGLIYFIDHFKYLMTVSAFIFVGAFIADSMSNALISLKMPSARGKEIMSVGFISMEAAMIGKLIGNLLIYLFTFVKIDLHKIYGAIWSGILVIGLISLVLSYNYIGVHRRNPRDS